MRIVIALGGNALLRRSDPMTTEVQRRNIMVAAQAIAPLATEHSVVVVHGNGPQVGLLSLQAEAYPGAEPYPLDVLDAGTQGMIGYLIEHAAQAGPDPFMEQLIAAALEVRAVRSAAARSPHVLAEPLTAAELRILKLLPTSTYLQMAATLYVSRNTVKTHLRSVYQKLGVASRAEAIERALDLQLL